MVTCLAFSVMAGSRVMAVAPEPIITTLLVLIVEVFGPKLWVNKRAFISIYLGKLGSWGFVVVVAGTHIEKVAGHLHRHRCYLAGISKVHNGLFEAPAGS